MTAPARMSRADSHRWNTARTPADLGDLMALWLEGGLASRPGYEPHWGPDDEALLDRLLRSAADTGMNTCVNHVRRRGGRQGQPIVVTTCDGQPVTAFGGRIRRADLALEWAGTHPRLFAQIATGTYLTIAAPTYGTTGQSLWRALDTISQPPKA
ncbi:DUF6919 domain-containing protein [Streptomyces albidoflavus]